MKNQKTCKSLLSFAMITSIFIAMLMMIMDMCVSGESWFVVADGTKLGLDWRYAGIYLAFMITALVTWAIRFFAYSLPCIKDKQCCTCLICECAIFIGLVIAIAALFIPVGMDVVGASSESEEMYDETRLIAGVVMAWIGLPLAFIASVFKSAHAIQAK